LVAKSPHVALIRKHLDRASWVVVLITLALFVTAVFVKGLGHDLLLEAGVFLVSVKLIVMAYQSSVTAGEVRAQLDELRAALARIDARLGAQPEHGRATPAAPQGGVPTDGLPAEIGVDARR
jgi:hypothetical protein